MGGTVSAHGLASSDGRQAGWQDFQPPFPVTDGKARIDRLDLLETGLDRLDYFLSSYRHIGNFRP